MESPRCVCGCGLVGACCPARSGRGFPTSSGTQASQPHLGLEQQEPLHQTLQRRTGLALQGDLSGFPSERPEVSVSAEKPPSRPPARIAHSWGSCTAVAGPGIRRRRLGVPGTRVCGRREVRERPRRTPPGGDCSRAGLSQAPGRARVLGGRVGPRPQAARGAPQRRLAAGKGEHRAVLAGPQDQFTGRFHGTIGTSRDLLGALHWS